MTTLTEKVAIVTGASSGIGIVETNLTYDWHRGRTGLR
jgi:NADP-dependent 3-hydroxy acid dehydrogenase YdfG